MAIITAYIPGFGVVVNKENNDTVYIPGLGVFANQPLGITTRQWMTPEGYLVDENAEREYMLAVGFLMNEDQPQPAPPAGVGRLLLINPPGLDGGMGGGLTL